MNPRLNPFAAAPSLMQPMLDMEEAIKASPLGHTLIELIKLRVSQINGCAFCIHMHTHDARAHGESEDRMHLLNAWRESPLYSDKERAALAWAEDLTRIDRTGAPDATYTAMTAHFDDAEQVALTLLITTINAWNRIAIGFATPHPVGKEASAA